MAGAVASGTESVTLGRGKGNFLEVSPYSAPEWAASVPSHPTEIYNLAQLPTPIHEWKVPGLPEGTKMYIKRDDLTGMQLSGNKVRKLEFLLAEALARGCDCVVTIGGIQSNHCRATAVAAKFAGLEAHLVLRTSRPFLGRDPGLVGNLLVERLAGAHIHLVSKEDYVKHGSMALGQVVVDRLLAQGRKPFLVPVGGSNGLGTWGYLEAVHEIESQLSSLPHPIHDIVMACGSGGTTAGLALGVHLSSLQAKVHAYGVCDSPSYFYEFIQGIFDSMGLAEADVAAKDVVDIKDAKGQGYAMSSKEELELVKVVAEATGIILDPVYSGKALFGLLRDIRESPSQWEGRNILFVHTGGLLGMYDKEAQLQPLMGKWEDLVVPGSN